jgi:diamine N-acetyltransferase
VAVTLGEITDRNREAVLALRVAPGQERFVGSVRNALAAAARDPHANPWYRAVRAGGEPVGFVMVSWDVEPQPPEIIGPWFLLKLLIDQRHQGRGYGAEAVRQVAGLVRAEGATELLTSYFRRPPGPVCVPGIRRPVGWFTAHADERTLPCVRTYALACMPLAITVTATGQARAGSPVVSGMG